MNKEYTEQIKLYEHFKVKPNVYIIYWINNKVNMNKRVQTYIDNLFSRKVYFKNPK